MAAYYVNSAAGGSNTGANWTNAYTTFGAAVTAATAAGDVIYVHQGHSENLTASTTYTFANHVSVICSNDTTNTPPQTLGVMGDSNWIGHSTTSYRITLSGAYRVFIYGLTFRVAGSSNEFILGCWTDGAHFEFDHCLFWLGTGSGGYVSFNSTTNLNAYSKLKACIFRFGHSGQKLALNQTAVLEGCSIHASSSIPTAFLLPASSSSPPCFTTLTGCDLSLLSGTLVGGHNNGASQYVFSNCKLHASATPFATQTPANKGAASAWFYNCASGDQHYQMAHYDALGSTIVETGIYANDGAQYDGTNRCSWKITSTAECSYYTPYVSPWIDCYHSGTSAITPSLEILRDGSSTAYQDDEVWGEFSYQGTSGYPISTIVSDKKDLLASTADQTTGNLNASGWTGENATSWFGKLNPTVPITPAEIGHLRARVCVGEPSVTVYVDPTIRGRS